MKYYAVNTEELMKLGVKDFSEFEKQRICIWWDKETVMDMAKNDNADISDKIIEEAVDNIFEDLCFIDSSDINREIELQSNDEIKRLLGEKNGSK